MSADPKRSRVGPDATAEDVNLDEEPVVLSDGTVLDEEGAERLGKEVAARWGRPGRPSLSGKRTHSPQIRARVTPRLQQQLAERAEREGKKPSQIIREALERYLSA